MYEALVARVRYHIQKANFMGLKEAESTLLLAEAADAIEQLTADLEWSKEYEGFWKEKAEEAKGKLQQYALAVANKPRWIPVTERLPEVRTWVLCFCRANSFDVFRMTDEGHWQYGNRSIYMKGYVTHWMPLPKAPEEEYDAD